MHHPLPSSILALTCLALSLTGHVVGFAVATRTPQREAQPAKPAVATRDDATGNSFEIPLDETPTTETGSHSASTASEALPVSPEAANAPSASGAKAAAEPRTHAKARSVASTAANDATGTAEGADAPGAARYGAVGDRSAAELATAFTRGFPQAASADPSWVTAPLGSAGTVDVTLTIDEAGALTGARSSGPAGPALAEGIRRTVALIRARAFVADGKDTRLRVTATVTKDQVHDGLHGEVFAIGGSFDRHEGSGFFALAMGRRIDVKVEVLR